MRVARASSTSCPPIPKGFTCLSTILASYSVVLRSELLPLALACWLAQPGTVAGAGTIADGIRSGYIGRCGIRRLVRGAGHRDPGDRIVPAVVALNGPVGRNVLVDLAVVPKFRILGRNVLAD